MCKVRDVALAMLQKSINLSHIKNDLRYQMDYVKLHKMLYLGQCMVLAKYDMPLFEERITAHRCGPYIEEIHFIAARYGFEKINSLTDRKRNETPVVLQLPFLRDEVVDNLIEKYGCLTTDEIVDLTKKTSAYVNLSDYLDGHPEISVDEMKKVGEQLLSS